MLANDDNRIKDSLTDVSPTDVSSQGVIELPFQSIARAREESKLVRLVLRRYCADQPINTVFKGTRDKTSSTPGEFPGRCYGTVRVCLACFCVYDLIEHARYLSRRGLEQKQQSPVLQIWMSQSFAAIFPRHRQSRW